jgi:FkbM family methyltransferase
MFGKILEALQVKKQDTATPLTLDSPVATPIRVDVAADVSIWRDQCKLLRDEAAVIFDVGAQNGDTTVKYAELFPTAKIYAFEPSPSNFQDAALKLCDVSGRVHLSKCAISDRIGEIKFHLNSHSGTHSILPIGDVQYWREPASNVDVISVPCRTVDSIVEEERLDQIDILKMDIQGGELAALKGARKSLEAGRINIIVAEVEFQPLYSEQPLFWEIGQYLANVGYHFFGLYDCQFHRSKPALLCWADAIFVGPKISSQLQTQKGK